jgi:hypothetical protein
MKRGGARNRSCEEAMGVCLRVSAWVAKHKNEQNSNETRIAAHGQHGTAYRGRRGTGSVERKPAEIQKAPVHTGRADTFSQAGLAGQPYQAMRFEISLGRMSAATPNVLFVGERVELYPVMGFRAKAVVRRKNGAMYGFEFVDLDGQQQAKIGKTCEGLPEFQSMIDV